MKYIVIVILIILLVILSYYNKETFVFKKIDQINYDEMNTTLPTNSNYTKLVDDIVNQLNKDLENGTFFSNNIDSANISVISKNILEDKEIKNNLYEKLNTDSAYKSEIKGDQGDRGDSGVNRKDEPLSAKKIIFNDQILDNDPTSNHVKASEIINFKNNLNELKGDKLIINPDIDKDKALSSALDEGVTLIPSLNLKGNTVAKDGKFIKIENGKVSKLRIGNQNIISNNNTIFMDDANISNVNVDNLTFQNNDLEKGPIGDTGDKGDQGFRIQNGAFENNYIKLSNKEGGNLNLKYQTETPIKNLYGPRGDKGDIGLTGNKGSKGFGAQEGNYNNDILEFNYYTPEKHIFLSCQGDKVKGETGNKGPKGEKGSKGPSGSNINYLSINKGNNPDELKLRLENIDVAGSLKVNKGIKGDTGDKGNKGRTFGFTDIENKPDELLFKTRTNLNERTCFDNNMCLSEIKDKLRKKSDNEIIYNLCSFLQIDASQSFIDSNNDLINNDLINYHKKITNIYTKNILEMYNNLFSETYFSEVKLCVKAEIDVLGTSKDELNKLIFTQMPTKLNITTQDTINELLKKDTNILRNTYLRIRLEDMGFTGKKFDSLSNEDYFKRVLMYVTNIFGEDKEKGIYGINVASKLNTNKKLFKFIDKNAVIIKRLKGKINGFFDKTETELKTAIKS